MWYCPPAYGIYRCPPLQDQTNMYGLGIRIGLYLIWFAAILAYALIHDGKDRTGLRDLNYWFCLAFLLSLIIDNKRNYLADSLVVVLLLASSTTLLTILEVIDRTRPRDKRRSHPDSHRATEFVRLFFLGAFVVYLNYWWFNGIYHTAKICGLSAYYFTHRKRIRGSFRFVGQVWSPLLAIALVPVVIQFVLWGHRKRGHARLNRERAAAEGATARRAGTNPLKKDYWASPRPAPRAPGAVSSSSSSSDSSHRRRRSRRSKRGLYTAWVLGILMLFLILHIEIMLAYSQNRAELNGVKNSAQLIPLLIGIASLILVFWRLLEQRKRICKAPHYRGHESAFLYSARAPFPFNRSTVVFIGRKFFRISSRPTTAEA